MPNDDLSSPSALASVVRYRGRSSIAGRTDPLELEASAAALAGATAEEVLTFVARRFPARVGLATGFGREGCVLIDMVARLGVELRLFTLDTGLLFPETYALWHALEARYGRTIHGVTPVLPPGADADRLWARDPDACCELRKVAPLRRALAGLDAWVTAIRRDQTSARATARALEWDARSERVKVNPLVGWTDADVDAYVARHDVPINALHAQGYPSIGCAPCTGPVAAGEDPRAGRWRGREKTECGLHADRRRHHKEP